MIFLLSLAFADVPEYTYLERGMEAPFSGRLFNDTASQLLADQVEKVVKWELSEQIRLQKTEDFKEGTTAFLEKRKPEFPGN